jgi:hypothetical protein
LFEFVVETCIQTLLGGEGGDNIFFTSAKLFALTFFLVFLTGEEFWSKILLNNYGMLYQKLLDFFKLSVTVLRYK